MDDNTAPLAPSARDRIARLRVRFMEQLPQRVLDLQALWNALQADPRSTDAVEALHRSLHNLKGTASSFGFADLGCAAEQAEACVAAAQEEGGAALGQQRMVLVAGSLAVLDEQVRLLSKPGGLQAWEDLPSFTVSSGAIGLDGKAGGRLIYMCDDDPFILEKIAGQISCFGYQCECFKDTQALRSAILARRPDAVIMDIIFPAEGLDGTRALAELQQDLGGAAVPTVFISARGDFDARIKAVRAGGQAFLQKPVDALALAGVLDRLTGQQKPGAYRILIVDDEPEMASYHSVLLQDAGMNTYELADPTRIMAALEEFRPDLVLLDIYLPQCNGRELASLIRQIPDYVSIPIIYLSSELDHKKQFSAMRIGAEGFLTKPVQPEQLIESVSVRAERMRVLRAMMARDSLTGLLNHSETTKTLVSAMAAARRTAGSMCFAMLDIDNFKHVNDTYGHPVGDQVLLALSRLLQQRLRISDTVGRYGGEEFAIILRDVQLPEATALLESLREAFTRVQFHTEQADFSCSFSAGIAWSCAYSSMASLREAADKALYAAKRGGRNRVMTANAPQEAGA